MHYSDSYWRTTEGSCVRDRRDIRFAAQPGINRRGVRQSELVHPLDDDFDPQRNLERDGSHSRNLESVSTTSSSQASQTTVASSSSSSFVVYTTTSSNKIWSTSPVEQDKSQKLANCICGYDLRCICMLEVELKSPASRRLAISYDYFALICHKKEITRYKELSSYMAILQGL